MGPVAEIDYANLLLIAVAAVAAPPLVAALRVPVPEVVVMIVAGIVLGPSVLGWVDVDVPVQVLAALGLAYLLFVSGLEIEVEQVRGEGLRVGLLAFALSAALSLVAALALQAAGLIDDVLFLVATLLTTSPGIVVAVLKELDRLRTPMGQLTLLGAALGDFVSVTMLSLVFSGQASAGARILLVSLFAVTVVVVVAALAQASAVHRLRRLIAAKSGAATQLTVRASFALMVGFAALAGALGLEAILGAFAAGVAVSVLDAGAAGREEARAKLEAIGFGVLAPIFFVASGLRFDLAALADGASLALVPLLIVAMLLARALPAVAYRNVLTRREAAASGLLQATKLTFVVAAVTIGQEAGVVGPGLGAALIAAGIVTVIAFPTIAGALLRGEPLVAYGSARSEKRR